MKTAISLIFALGIMAPAMAAENPKTYGRITDLPAPEKSLIPTVNTAKAVGWPEGQKPIPAEGLQVNEFAGGFDHPRWVYVLPNGDVLVAETHKPPRGASGVKEWIQGQVMKHVGASGKSANRITLLRDKDKDGVAEERHVFLQNLFSPFGMTLVGETFYVANADSIVAFPYKQGQTTITAAGKTLTDLPAGRNHHWTKNLIANKDGTKLYASVGSNSNVAENGMEEEEMRAAILEVDIKTGEKRIYGSGLRNPVGMDWNPVTGDLWTAVNERDELGNDLVPDYITSVKDGGFYGWPYSYFGSHVDDRVKPPRPDLVAKAIVPDYAVGAHTASLGLHFYRGKELGAEYENGAFIGQHGSWNRNPRSGYKLLFVPFKDGKPDGMPRDILTGFVNDKDEAWGRPVGVIQTQDGAVLMVDDVGNNIWRVSKAK